MVEKEAVRIFGWRRRETREFGCYIFFVTRSKVYRRSICTARAGCSSQRRNETVRSRNIMTRAQGVALVLFAVIGIRAAIRFRPGPALRT